MFNKTSVLLVLAMLVLVCSTTAAQTITVSPSSIERTISTTTYVTVTITNNLNETVHIIITKGGDLDLTLSSSEFDVSPNSQKSITVTLNPSTYSGKLYYFWSSSNNSGVVNQVINVTKSHNKVKILPETVEVDLIENQTIDYPITIINPTTDTVDIIIDYSGGIIKDVSKTHFSISPDDASIINIRLRGLDGEGKINYTVEYPGSTEEYTQNVVVNAHKPEYANELEELRNRIKELENDLNNTKAKLYLPDNIKVDVSDAIVGRHIKITVTGLINGAWKPLDSVIVGVDGYMSLTDSSGTTHITLNKAGTYTIKIYDKLGNIKYQKVVDVKKEEIELSIPEIKLGKIFNLDLPERGELTIYKDNTKINVLQADSSTNIMIDEPGKYKFVFNSQSYTGSAETVVKGKIKIIASVNGRQLKPTDKVNPGDVITVYFKYEGGKPAKVDATYQVFPESGKMDKEKMYDILMMQMMTSYFSDSGTDVILPTFGKMSDTSSMQIVVPDEGGILTIKADGGVYAESGALTLHIQPAPINPLTIVVPTTLVGITSFLFVYKASPRFRNAVLNSKLGARLKNIRSRDVEPPI